MKEIDQSREKIKLKETMKVYNFENIKSEDDLKRLSELVSTQPAVIVLDTFVGIAERLRSISIALFHIEVEKARKEVQSLEDYCLDWLDNLLPFGTLKTNSNKLVEECLDQISLICNNTPNFIDDRDLIAQGSMISSIIFSAYLQSKKKANHILDSCKLMQLGTDRNLDLEYSRKNKDEMMQNSPEIPLYIVQSRLCKNVYGEINLLPHGGNDYYTIAVGTLFHANEIILPIRVDGIYTHSETGKARILTFSEAENFIDCGISLLTPPCITLARSANMTIHLMKSSLLTEEVLHISAKAGDRIIKAVVSRKKAVFIKLRSLNILPSYLFIGKIFDVLEKYKVSSYLVTSSNVSISLAANCSRDTTELICRELRKYADIGAENDMTVVSIIGDLNWEYTKLESQIIETLKDIPVYMISYGSSNHNVSILIKEKDREKVLLSLAEVFLGVPSLTGYATNQHHPYEFVM